ncbi:MAG: hypothetical protein GDA50_00180 [Alphaproteobacteria bacterium GM202ARS2]|nr:hypothetical protein [Alphaproteobacteria bacterium GM202ARS2]
MSEGLKNAFFGAFYGMMVAVVLGVVFVVVRSSVALSIVNVLTVSMVAGFLSVAYGMVAGLGGWSGRKIMEQLPAFCLGVMLVTGIELSIVGGIVGGVALWWSVWGR